MSLSTLLGKINNDKNTGKKVFLEVIQLIKERAVETPRDQRLVIRLRSNPTDDKSPQYEIVTRGFDYGTPEEWIRHKKVITQILSGQNITRGPDKFRMTRRLLTGKAIADFEAAIITNSYSETTNDLEKCLAAVGLPIFPSRAIEKQKRALRRHMPKPKEMPVTVYWARLVELNAFFEYFPDADAYTPLSEDELKQVFEYGLPKTWSMQMTLTRFVPMDRTPPKLVAFCRELEGIEAEHGSLDVIGVYNNRGAPRVPRRDRTDRRSTRKGKRKQGATESDSKPNLDIPCPFHPNGKHTLRECSYY